MFTLLKDKMSCMLIFAVLLSVFISTGELRGETVTTIMHDIDSGTTSPAGIYRWLDIADQAYSTDYQNSYNYIQATVTLGYNNSASSLIGTLNAANLKPNFAYQLKLMGKSDAPGNEGIGMAGRWWQEEWNGSAWTGGANLNNKGNGLSPNPNDYTYYSRLYQRDTSSPTGWHYRYQGYLPFDYFITDKTGAATLSFEADSSYHVLFNTTQQTRTTSDGPLKSSTFDADNSLAYNDTSGNDYNPKTVSIFGEWERLPVGGNVFLQPGHYEAEIMLTEESFHGSGGALAGGWAGALGTEVDFTTTDHGTGWVTNNTDFELLTLSQSNLMYIVGSLPEEIRPSNPAGTLKYNDQLGKVNGLLGEIDLTGLAPNHDYLLSFEGVPSGIHMTAAELAAAGISYYDNGRWTTPGGIWNASASGDYGEFAGLEVLFVDFKLITTDADGNFWGTFFFNAFGDMASGWYETRFIVKDAYSWTIHDYTDSWRNEVLFANDVDFDPPSVPEPSSLLLTVLGILGVGIFRKR